jgi:predicted DNA-binding ribbon-helix-helix protein
MPMNSPKYDPDPFFHPLETRNIVVCGHRTSIKLEPYLWQSLEDIALREHLTISSLCTVIKDLVGPGRLDVITGPVTLTSMIRVFILLYFRNNMSLSIDKADEPQAFTPDPAILFREMMNVE